MRLVSTTLSRRLLSGVGLGLTLSAAFSLEANAADCGYTPLQCYQGFPASQPVQRWQGPAVPFVPQVMPQQFQIPMQGPMQAQQFNVVPQLRRPFQIRVSHPSQADANAMQDMNLQWTQSLEAVNIQVKNDGLEVKLQLNVNTHVG